jgi:hypothetical protein
MNEKSPEILATEFASAQWNTSDALAAEHGGDSWAAHHSQSIDGH